jgi:hypothetical protein
LLDETLLALLIAILKKNKESALWWAYEIYYSGFKELLWRQIMFIYYDYFYVLNPNYKHVLEKYVKYLSTKPQIITIIISDLILQEYTLDVFIMRQFCSLFELEIEDEDEYPDSKYRNQAIHFTKMLNSKQQDSHDTYPYAGLAMIYTEQFYKTTNLNVKETIYIAEDVQVLKMIEKIRIDCYETVEFRHGLKSRQILSHINLKSIDEYNSLSIFSLMRNKKTDKDGTKIDVKELYATDWLYYASFSPIWFQRIQQFKGWVNFKNKKIVFLTEDLEDEFMKLYNYDFDEQNMQVKNNYIINTQKILLNDFLSCLNTVVSLITTREEELDELKDDIVLYNNTIISKI